MKAKILKATKNTFWYAGSFAKEENMIGKVRTVRFGRPRVYKFFKNPIKWIKSVITLEDKDLSTKTLGHSYDWKDIKIIAF